MAARDRRTDTEWSLSSRLVVGADGRFSTVRHAAGIDPRLTESRLRLVWFKLPRTAVERDELARVEPGGVLGYIPLGRDTQVLVLVADDEYEDLRPRGVAALHRRVVAVDPVLRPALEAYLDSFDQCSVLAPDPGISEEWVRDGLVLVGDAAHVANPFGAQGNSLAIQDAVAAHPHIVRGLVDQRGPLRAGQLRAYEDVRRPAVREVMGVQAQQLRAISFYVRHRESIPTAVWKAGIRGALETLQRVPRLARRRVQVYAFGPDPVPVDTSMFEA